MIRISPIKMTLNPSDSDDQIISGVELSVDPNGNTLTVSTGRIRLNSVYIDVVTPIQTDLSSAPVGQSLLALDETQTLRFLDDNAGTLLGLAVVSKRIIGTSVYIDVTPISYILAGNYSQSIVQSVFSPTVGIETQLKMLFEELAYNKSRDAELKYEEILENLPTDYNTILIENFKDTSFFKSNELAYNPHSKTVALGLLAPYPAGITKTLVESVTLPNAISQAYFSIDMFANGGTCSVRLSFDNGVNWVPYTKDDFYSCVAGNKLVVEVKMTTASSLQSPLLRSWALFYHKA